MVTFLFWNTNRKPLLNEIQTLVREHQIDIVILGELETSPVSLLQHLNSGATSNFRIAAGQYDRIRIFTRFSSEFLTPTYEDEDFHSAPQIACSLGNPRCCSAPQE